MAKIIINVMLFLSGVFFILAIHNDLESKRRSKRIKEMNDHFNEVMKVVNGES